MRSNYIVPEAASSLRNRPATKLVAGLFALGIALYLLDSPTPSNELDSSHSDAPNPPAEEIRLASSLEQNQAEEASFFSDLAPISNAEASIHRPVEISQQPLDPTEAAATEADPALQASDQELSSTADAPVEPRIYKQVIVKPGDSLSTLFARHDLKTRDWLALSRLPGEARRLLKLQPGDQLKLQLNEQQELLALDVSLDATRSLRLEREAESEFTQSIIEQAIEVREVLVEGQIENSLFLAAKAAGLSDRLTMELTEIFAWDIDFALDIRTGDSFRVVFEEILSNGEKIKEGNILAAEFRNRGELSQAVRYTNEQGRSAYYTPDGQPMKKAFLRSPVDFTRISSRFSSGRKHPILNRIRAHRGVDYAAARGTPIRSAGDGKVVFAGVKGGYGNVLIVQHAGKYKTLYAHMQNFHRGIRRGSHVNQGQVIGYVGSSGLATGPHLHYEFLINDSHVNPLTVKLPSSPKIPSQAMAHFKDQTSTLLAKLEPNRTTTELADAR